MNLILIRHGETIEGKKGILLGKMPGHLSDAGFKEMKAMSKKIKEKDLDPELIISSDNKRAQQSAEILSKNLGIKVVYDKLLRERGGGVAEGKKEDEIDWTEYEKVQLPYRKHLGGESYIDVLKRAKAFLLRLSQTKHKSVIIVSHSVFLAMMLSSAKKMGIEESLEIKFKEPIVISLARTARAQN